jgi:glucosamine--fructose-6-phosphate aminotransferase (isomerizing)
MKKIPYATAIPKQPDVLERNRAGLVAAAVALREHKQRIAPTNPVVGLLGIGASYYAGLAAVRELWQHGVRAHAIDAGQLWEDDDLDVADIYLAISASGKSLETVEAIRRIRTVRSPLVVAVMAEDTDTLGALSDLSVPCADPEDSVPATISYLGTIQALAFLAAALGDGDIDAVNAEWAAVPATVTQLIAAVDDGAKASSDALARTPAVDFVGDKDSIGSAAEGALVFREAPRIATSWFDSRSYLHGPMESLDRERGLVLIGDPADDGLAIIRRQAEEIGCASVLVTHRPVEEPQIAQLAVPARGGRLVRHTLEMVALQVITRHVSEKLELTSGRFRYPQPQVKLSQVS